MDGRSHVLDLVERSRLWTGRSLSRPSLYARLFVLVGFLVFIFLYMDLSRPYACSGRGSGAHCLSPRTSPPLSHPIELLSLSLVSFDTSPGSFFFFVLFRVLLAPLCLVFSPLFLFLSVIMIDDYRPFPHPSQSHFPLLFFRSFILIAMTER